MKTILYFFICVLPRASVGKILKKLFTLEKPKFIADILKKLFVWFYKIDLNEAEYSLDYYKSTQALFCRRLKKNQRTTADNALIAAPVDGLISECGRINNNTLIQAKGIDYTLDDLLLPKMSSKFVDGWFCTIYLAPYNYHRIHSPITAEIIANHYQPGDFWPVNNITVPRIKNLFAINERITTFFEDNKNNFSAALVKVAALGVGNISVFYNDNYKFSNIKLRELQKQNFQDNQSQLFYFEPRIKINIFSEIALFAFGSTVILIFDKTVKPMDFNFWRGCKIKAGETLVKK